ncbi:NAD(P)/FAD-dependent oxidoreductase [Microbulbifer sp. OS29]|uniref:NAD(P)/FAD-dependent oxidoreductase n=1 Tax=Microbulbifer okhotskensis TaxID=2926617 RepID=A0A9X2J4Y0_9GAMM|nr:NAD(P)/FAD-dependent oxidoreductase [Microbulbifer okhotskensis]MCO1334618.1 NAD(P)/FAD-dependent oxidoreductase [Microbulbifer okhotskensis]
MKKIVIVGGGASGLHLATRLGQYFSFTPCLRRQRKFPIAQVTLVDKNRTHLWKPLLHQVASGALDANVDALNYQVHARTHGYEFQLGSLKSLNRKRKIIELEAVNDEGGNELVPERELEYDYLVLCIGGHSNDFHIPGIKEHCAFLDSSNEAQQFHQNLLNRFLRLETRVDKKLQVAIVGGGATGVELSAELVDAVKLVGNYGRIRPNAMEITLIEGGDHLLPALPKRIGNNAERELAKMGVKVLTGHHIAGATQSGLTTSCGREVPATIRVWAAGVKAPEFLTRLNDLNTNRLNQIEVETTLQTQTDPHIFAMGDCASCIDSNHQRVPPRAQAAQQMATLVGENIIALLEDKPLHHFYYRDRGSLVSLSQYTAIGNLMGALVKGSLTVEGRLAGLAYRSLYRMHLAAVHGWPRAMLLYLIGQANRFVKPKLKMH